MAKSVVSKANAAMAKKGGMKMAISKEATATFAETTPMRYAQAGIEIIRKLASGEDDYCPRDGAQEHVRRHHGAHTTMA